MRCRLILKLPSGSYKVASIYFSNYEPSFYIDFPYLSVPAQHFLGAKMSSVDGGNNLIYRQGESFFFDKSPKLSYHLSGQVHIKDSTGHLVPELKVETTRLDDLNGTRFLDIVIKNPGACKKFDPTKDHGTENEKNLIIDSQGVEPEVIEIRGVRTALMKDLPWFNEVGPNHPIVGGRIDPSSGKAVPAFFYCFQPTDEINRVLFCFEIDFYKEFYCDEDQLLYVRSGFTGDITDREYKELVIMAPRDPKKMNYVP